MSGHAGMPSKDGQSEGVALIPALGSRGAGQHYGGDTRHETEGDRRNRSVLVQIEEWNLGDPCLRSCEDACVGGPIHTLEIDTRLGRASHQARRSVALSTQRSPVAALQPQEGLLLTEQSEAVE